MIYVSMISIRRILTLSFLAVIFSIWSATAESSIEKISEGYDGSGANSWSDILDISTDGRYVLFTSAATNLMVNQTPGGLFLIDRMTGVIENITATNNESDLLVYTEQGTMSDDGRYVAYIADTHSLVAGTSSDSLGDQIFLYDRMLAKTTRVTELTSGVWANSYLTSPVISGNGNFIVFESWATNLVENDTNGYLDIFSYQVANGEIKRVSVSSQKVEANSTSHDPSVSFDGRYIVFESYADNLIDIPITGTNNYTYGSIYIHDTLTEETSIISVNNQNEMGNDYSSEAIISGDGHTVVFVSNSTNLVERPTINESRLFVRNLLTHETHLIEVPDSVYLSIFNTHPAISHDGLLISFKATTYDSLNNKIVSTLYIYEPQKIKLQNILEFKSFGPKEHEISPDGKLVAFAAIDSNLTHLDLNNELDVFVMDIFSVNRPYSGMTLTALANDLEIAKPWPTLQQGSDVNWRYEVTNTGNTILNDVAIRGRQKLPTLGSWTSLCTIGTIQPGATGSCTTTENVVDGTYKSLIVANGLSEDGTRLEVLIDAFYQGSISQTADPTMQLDVSANGTSVAKPGPNLSQGSLVNWHYDVINTGNTILHDVAIRGRQKLPTLGSWTLLCTIGTIQPGATGSCTITENVVDGTYKSLIVANGLSEDGTRLEVLIDAFYQGSISQTTNPAMQLDVSANGASAAKPGPTLSQGSVVNWRYEVINTGNTILHDVAIRGRQKLPTLGSWIPLCNIGTLQPGATGSCTTTENIVDGTFKSLVVANGMSEDSTRLQSMFDAFYNR